MAVTTGDSRSHFVRLGLATCFVGLALLNLLVLIQANQLAFSQAQQPYDFFVFLHASSQIFEAPALLYVHQEPGSFGPYWSPWLWYGASYLYAPWFAFLLSPLASVYPPYARLVWEALSYVLLVVACALTIGRVASTAAKFFLTALIFIMPLQLMYSDQTLPQYWLRPQMAGMWISPVFFADYYWGNTNTMILALGLLAYCFALGSGCAKIGPLRVQCYVLSALFLALTTFKVIAPVFIIPFWLAMNRTRIWKAIGFFALFTVALNGIALYRPSLLSGYLSMLVAQRWAPNRSALWQVYEYVWYYTLPVCGLVLLSRAGYRGSGAQATTDGKMGVRG